MGKELVKVEKVHPQITPALGVVSGRGFFLFSHFFFVLFLRFSRFFPTSPNLKFKASAEESSYKRCYNWRYDTPERFKTRQAHFPIVRYFLVGRLWEFCNMKYVPYCD